jgi:hypothetical protein
MTEPKRYEIEKIEDFLKVPPERRALCLAEFQTFLSIMDKVDELRRQLVAGLGIPAEALTFDGRFTWIDDDKGEAVVKVSMPDGETVLESRHKIGDLEKGLPS